MQEGGIKYRDMYEGKDEAVSVFEFAFGKGDVIKGRDKWLKGMRAWTESAML